VLSEEDVGGDEAVIERYASLARLLVVTRGRNGCTVYASGQARHFPAPPMEEIDPTGAGDIFAAAFFFCYRRRGSPWEAARFANCVAAHSVTRGGLDGTPHPDEVARCREILGEKTLFDQETYTSFAKPLEPSQLVFIPREEFMAFIKEHPEVAIRLIEKLSRELKAFGEKLVEVTCRSAKERVARLLWELANAYGEETEDGLDVGVELPRAELAEMAGVSSKTAIRALGELESRGIISLENRRIKVLKEDYLRRLMEPFSVSLDDSVII
jgi:CRP-like cAMP-binding protein